MADYKRRVSPIATIEVWYAPDFKELLDVTQRVASGVDVTRELCIPLGELGFAAGGRMYDPPRLRLSIVLLTLNIPERREYIKTKILPGYDVVAFQALESLN